MVGVHVRYYADFGTLFCGGWVYGRAVFGVWVHGDLLRKCCGDVVGVTMAIGEVKNVP